MDSHTALQPRNPSQAVCNGNHRAVSLEGKDPFYIDMLALQIKNILKNIKEERFFGSSSSVSHPSSETTCLWLLYAWQLYLDLSSRRGKEILKNSPGDNKTISNNHVISLLGRKIRTCSLSLLNRNPRLYSSYGRSAVT